LTTSFALPLAQAGVFELLAPTPPGWGGNLLGGFVSSIKIGGGAFALGLLFGTGGAYGKLYGGRLLCDLLQSYTTLIRAVPELVLILLIYFAVPDLITRILEIVGYGRFDVGGFAAGVIALGFVIGAYATEVLRGAILAVPQGQIEAGRAFGMSASVLMRRITLPAMLPFAIPGLANLWLVAIKNTALLAVVGFSELTLETRQAAGATKAYFTFFMAAGALYLLFTLVSNIFIGRIEQWARRGQPPIAGTH
jgi:polar amino acid transport system permease protein